MNFDLDEDQEALSAAARQFFSKQDSVGQARRLLDGDGDPSPGVRALAELGYLGIIVEEACGGAGATVLDLAVVAEQAGRYLSAPSLSTAARAAVLLRDHPALLRPLIDGSTFYAVVDGPIDRPAPAVDGAWADAYLAFDGGRLVLGGGKVAPSEPVDATRGLARVVIDDRSVVQEDAGEVWATAERIGQVILAAEDLGAASQVLDISVEYVKERRAFGRAVGSYQAIKHALVEVFIAVDQLRSLVWWAAWAADHAPSELPLAAAACAAAAGRTLEQAADTAIQVHGGIGFTWEHDAHLYWRRAKVDRLVYGDESTHLDAVARTALAGSDSLG
jgi:alkylation response protein AidB-like acyl-CoA dehydrogenase